MRRLLATVLLPMAVAAQAQVPPPPKLEPLPEASGRPGAGSGEARPDEPAVRIPAGRDDKVEHFNQGGRMMLKVTPPGGKPYYLIDSPGGWLRRDSLDDGTRVPMWPIHTFD
jgi:hypothetical protein